MSQEIRLAACCQNCQNCRIYVYPENDTDFFCQDGHHGRKPSLKKKMRPGQVCDHFHWSTNALKQLMSVRAIFTKVDSPPGPEAKILAVDARESSPVSISWDPGGQDLKNPLVRRPEGLFFTSGQEIHFISRHQLVDLFRQGCHSNQKGE